MIVTFLTIDQIGKLPYTYKEIIQKETPEFWNAASECGRVLGEWQNMIVELLPIYKEHLPDSLDKLTKKKPQIIMINYLKLRSIYSLAEKLWEQINILCHNLAVEKNQFKMEQVESLKHQLIVTFEKIESIPIVEIAGDIDNGFDRLHQEIHNYDFNVLPMRYSDICGTVYSKGLYDECLWNSAFNSQDPVESNLNGLMDSPDNNELIRIY